MTSDEHNAATGTALLEVVGVFRRQPDGTCGDLVLYRGQERLLSQRLFEALVLIIARATEPPLQEFHCGDLADEIGISVDAAYRRVDGLRTALGDRLDGAPLVAPIARGWWYLAIAVDRITLAIEVLGQHRSELVRKGASRLVELLDSPSSGSPSGVRPCPRLLRGNTGQV